VKSEITTTPAVTEERTVMVPKVETVIVTPAVDEVTLTLNAREAEHILNILGSRTGHDSRSGTTGDISFEYNVFKALDEFLEKEDPAAADGRHESAPCKREEARNAAFHASGGYNNKY
jgi:hypothetical protein